MEQTAAQGRARRIADELLAAVAVERRAAADQLRLVGELADAYRSVLPILDAPGGPRLVPAGGDGTCDITDLFACELGALLGLSPATAWALIRDTLNLRDRHPQVWALVQSAAVPAWQGRHVAKQCTHLDRDAAAGVDARIALSLTRLPWSRCRRRLAGLIAGADTEAHAEQVAAHRRERFLRIDHTPDGTSWVLGRLTTPDAVALEESIRAIAQGLRLDPTYRGTADHARADALGVLALGAGTGARAGAAPAATLVVHLDHTAVAHPDSIAALGRVTGPHGADDIGPVLLDQVRELLRHRRVRVLPVLDLHDDASADGYEIPDRIRARVELRDGHSRFPYATQPARACDLDHTAPWRPDGPAGQTRPSALGALHRAAHRAKHHGWRLTQPRPGVFRWVSPLGYRYLVDHRGTHDDPRGAPPDRQRSLIQSPLKKLMVLRI